MQYYCKTLMITIKTGNSKTNSFMITIDEIEDFINQDDTYMEIDEKSSSMILLITRKNGDVGEETHSSIDWLHANSLEKRLQHNFGDSINTDIETVDEWVYLTIDTLA